VDQLVQAIAMEFGLDVRRWIDSNGAVLNEFLLKLVGQQKEAVLIIDEAQNLTDELLEQVRLLPILSLMIGNCCRSF